jgi:hypothetical protein
MLSVVVALAAWPILLATITACVVYASIVIWWVWRAQKHILTITTRALLGKQYPAFVDFFSDWEEEPYSHGF